MFLRIVTGIRHHFEERFLEWSMAATATYWGWTLAQPGEAWVNTAAWAGMLRLMTEDAWGMISMLAGGFWLIALALNGTFAGTFYARASPWVRLAASAGSSIVWFQVVLSVTAVQTSGSGIYPLPLAMSLWCILNAGRDIAEQRHARHANSRGA